MLDFFEKRYNLYQARNQGGGEYPPRKIFSPMGKCVGYSLIILDIIQKISAPLRKLFAPPGVQAGYGPGLY